jgi:SNF2 family DNA or RNA helicase
VLIISYETFRANAKKLNAIKGLDLLVLDEGHRLKSAKGNQTITALQACPTRRRVLLTGTPVQNSMDEFFAMVSFVCPSLLGGIATFKRVFQQPIARGQDRDASETEIEIAKARADELQTLTQRFVLRRTSEILHKHLPDKVCLVRAS